MYDERCYFCARSLYASNVLDVVGSVRFHSQYTAPAEYRDRSDVDFETAMYTFQNGKSHEGYYAFRELLRHFRVFYPVILVVFLPVVQDVGEQVYAYTAANRGRHFACAVGVDSDE